MSSATAPAHLVSFLNYIAKSFELDAKELRAVAKKYDWKAGKAPKPEAATTKAKPKATGKGKAKPEPKPAAKAKATGKGKGKPTATKAKPGPAKPAAKAKATKGKSTATKAKPGPKAKDAKSDPLALTAKPLKTRNATATVKDGIPSQKVTKDGDSITIEPKDGETLELTLNDRHNFVNQDGVVFVNVPVENPSGRDAMRYVAIGLQQEDIKGEGLDTVLTVEDAGEFHDNGLVGLPVLSETVYKFIKKSNKVMAKLLERFVMSKSMIEEAEEMARSTESEGSEEEGSEEESEEEEGSEEESEEEEGSEEEEEGSEEEEELTESE